MIHRRSAESEGPTMTLVTHYATINGIGSRIYAGARRHGRRDGEGQSLFVEAVLYRYRTGIPWRDPARAFRHFASCTRGSALGEKGVWNGFSSSWR